MKITGSKLVGACLALVVLGTWHFVQAQTPPSPPTGKGTPRAAPKAPAPKVTPTLNLPPAALRDIPVSNALKQALAQKRLFDPNALTGKVVIQNNIPSLKLKSGAFVKLEPPGAEPPVPQSAKGVVHPQLKASLTKYAQYMANPRIGRALASKLLMVGVNHASWQTPIRDQGVRGTCVAHAALAGLEAYYKKTASVTKDLSENHAYNIFMAQVGSTCMADPGIQTYRAADFLTSNRVCEEAQSPYVNNKTTACQTIPPACSGAPKKYGYLTTTKYFSPEFGGAAPNTVTNTNLLESLLSSGLDVVLGVYVAGTDWSDDTAQNGVIDVQRQANGNPAPAYGGHAMLLTGYNQTNNYFIFKNSWGAAMGHAGYFHLSYEYLQTYAKYGYVILAATNP